MRLWKKSLREKCPNTEFFLVRIFLYSDWIQENRDQKKLRMWTLFTYGKCIIFRNNNKTCHYLTPDSYTPFIFNITKSASYLSAHVERKREKVRAIEYEIQLLVIMKVIRTIQLDSVNMQVWFRHHILITDHLFTAYQIRYVTNTKISTEYLHQWQEKTPIFILTYFCWYREMKRSMERSRPSLITPVKRKSNLGISF